MFVVQHKGRVISGPMAWNRPMFQGALEDVKVDFPLPREYPGVTPFVVDANTSIYEVELIQQEIDPRCEYLHGPFWEFTETKAIGTYQIVANPLEQVKGAFKQEVTDKRYVKEVAGAKVVIQGVEVSVDTQRGSRDVFVQKYLLMTEGSTVQWKFPEGWMTLSKTELGQVVQAGVAHVQASFDWEKQKHAEIDAAVSAAQLKTLNLE